MGVIRNPEKISYILDTKFINFRDFPILGGEGWAGAPGVGGGYVQHGVTHFFQNIGPNKKFYQEKIDFTSFARKRHIPLLLAEAECAKKRPTGAVCVKSVFNWLNNSLIYENNVFKAY